MDEVILVVKGDANLDGRITLSDSTLIKAVYNRLKTVSAEAEFASDVNGDGNITLSDSTLVKAVYNKLLTMEW